LGGLSATFLGGTGEDGTVESGIIDLSILKGLGAGEGGVGLCEGEGGKEEESNDLHLF
jgi:hypothetical protein